jgi:hypothetical protein
MNLKFATHAGGHFCPSRAFLPAAGIFARDMGIQ